MSMITKISPPNSGLAKYNGTWGRPQIIHLLRRTMFGAKKEDISFFETLNIDQAIATLLTVPTTAPSPPVNGYNDDKLIDIDVPAGQSWVNVKNTTDGTIQGRRRLSWKTWWINLMINQDRNILEKMVAFWQNHFGTGSNSVGDARFVYKHNALLREYALGNFKTLIKSVTLDPAMLVFLNGRANNKTSPDENYGRELQELFTVGKGAGSNYTEADVKAAARVLTGYRIDSDKIASYFDSTRHDTGNKQFSAFYKDTIIKGKTGVDGQKELDELLNMIFATEEIAKFICRKLYIYFIYYKITDDIEANVITPLAKIFRDNNYEIKPVLSALFQSEHFFDPANMGCFIKTPYDLVIGTLRQMKAKTPQNTEYETQYKIYTYLKNQLTTQQQDPGEPQNVAGYPAYYQSPQFHELWISPATLPARNQFTDAMIGKGFTANKFTLTLDPIAFAATLDNPDDPNKLITESVQLLLGIDLSDVAESQLKPILLSGQAKDSYWTEAWNNYINNPTDKTALQIVTTRLKTLYQYLMNLAEYQLS